MNDSDNAQEPCDTPQEEQEAPQEEQEPVPMSAKAKQKPRQPKEPKQPKESKRKSKVITVDVGHPEYFDPKTPNPQFEDLPDAEQTPPEVIGPPPPPALVRQPSSVDAKPKAKSRAKAQAKSIA